MPYVPEEQKLKEEGQLILIILIIIIVVLPLIMYFVLSRWKYGRWKF